MGTVAKWGTLIIGTAFVTTLILPNRQTVPVLGAVGKLTTGTLSTAMGTSQGAVA